MEFWTIALIPGEFTLLTLIAVRKTVCSNSVEEVERLRFKCIKCNLHLLQHNYRELDVSRTFSPPQIRFSVPASPGCHEALPQLTQLITEVP